jgi:hypothetical protein
MTISQLADLKEALINLDVHPRSIMVNADGYCTTPYRSIVDYAVVAEAVLIRHDGWTLGFPLRFADRAFDLWARQWVGLVALPVREGFIEIVE